MFNLSEIMKAAWNKFRRDLDRCARHGFKAPTFGAALREAWIEAKAVAYRVARAAQLAAMDSVRAEIEKKLDEAVFLPMGKSFLNEVTELRSKLAAL